MRLSLVETPLVYYASLLLPPPVDASAKHKTWSTFRWEYLVEKWLWKPWNDGSFYWNVLDMCFQTLDDFGDENVEAWALALYKTDGCLDAIPFQFYRTTTIPEYWVGLDWKLIYLSISFLPAKVWAEATLWRLSTCAVPKMTVGHGWEAKLTGEVLILGRVIERLGLIIRILSMVNSGFVPDGCIECCGESVQSLQSVKLFE